MLSDSRLYIIIRLEQALACPIIHTRRLIFGTSLILRYYTLDRQGKADGVVWRLASEF